MSSHHPVSTYSSLAVPKRPRITFPAIKELSDRLDIGGWDLFAGNLDQEIFTDLWIERIGTRCGLNGTSPTTKVVRHWQKKFRCDEDVPVHEMIAVLKKMGRIDVSSIIEEMVTNGAFLDPIDEQSVSCDSFWSWPVSVSSNSRGDGLGGMSASGGNWMGAVAAPSCKNHPSDPGWSAHQAPLMPKKGFPVESSYRPWFGEEQGSSVPSAQTFTPNQREHHPKQNLMQNFSKSKMSLVNSALGPHPASTRDYNTWPHGLRHYSSKPLDCSEETDSSTSEDSYSSWTSIAPLRSMCPSSVPASSVGNRWFITYSHHDYKGAFTLGSALKSRGHHVDVDTKFSSPEECQGVTSQRFKEASHIVVLYTQRYFNEITSNKDSRLNTRLIYDLMMKEYRKLGDRNERFVPVLEQSRDLPVPPLLRKFPRNAADYIGGILGANHQDQSSPCVSIERTFHLPSHRRARGPP